MDSQHGDRRTGNDRRLKPTRPISRFMFSGLRQSSRRKGDKKSHLYVDRYDHFHFLALLLIVILSVLDGYFTIFHVSKGAQEINPVMNLFLGYGDICFFVLKYVLTAMAVFIFCIYQNLLVVRAILVIMIVFYAIALANHLVLMVMW